MLQKFTSIALLLASAVTAQQGQVDTLPFSGDVSGLNIDELNTIYEDSPLQDRSSDAGPPEDYAAIDGSLLTLSIDQVTPPT